MSHFSVLVIGSDVKKQLAPYHEFECTGRNDEYVQEIDTTEEDRAEYEKYTRPRLKDPDGGLHDPYQDRFYRDPAAEEIAKHGMMGSGGGNGISWTSKDWNDGRGYRAKVHVTPDGWEEIQVPCKDIMSFRDFIEYWDGRKSILESEAPDVEGDQKYGYVVVNKTGEVVKSVDRTNPERKWDGYQIGGRWTGFFKVKNRRSGLAMLGEAGIQAMNDDYEAPGPDRADVCLKRDINFEGMRNEAGDKAAKDYDLYTAATCDYPPIVLWADVIAKHTVGEKTNWDSARGEYNSQPGVIGLLKNYKTTGWLEPENFACAREEYIEWQRKRAISTFAVVKDGRWYEKGNMGWFGCVRDEKDKNEWLNQFNQLIDNLPDETLLTIVDCHI